MSSIRERKSWVVLFAILFLFAACKGDSPTAPPVGGGGGSTPPTGVSIGLVASNTSPVVDSTVTITATVTQNGAPVPNGTAVEFVSTGGLLDGSAAATIKTTTNGVATVTLSSSSAANLQVTATVGNVSNKVGVTFNAKPVEEQPPDLTPTISAVSPAIGRPAGGEIVRISGTNFKTPLKVLFDVGGLTPVEAFVASSTETMIEAVAPAVNLGAGQQLVADIIVITQFGTSAEQRAEASDAFTYRNEQLTPVVHAVTPNSGPVVGGTQIAIIGEGFQAPVQVMFSTDGASWAEINVISIKYGEIVAITPNASHTAPAGSGTVVGPVSLRVRNIASNTSVDLPNAFRYVADMQITAVTPGEGPYTGGTRVTIDGAGFVSPVTVNIGGRVAQPISVSGSKIVAITTEVPITACADIGGAVTVTNIVNGDSAAGPAFTYRVPKPLISNISPATVNAGGNVQVTVLNASPGVTRIKLGDREFFPSSSVFNDDGSAVFTVAVPSNFEFETESCTVGGVSGEREVASTVDVTYVNLETTCTNTLVDGLEIEPDDTSCVLPPAPNAVMTPTTPPCFDMGNIVAAGAVTGATNFTVTNTGGQPLIISAVTLVASSNATATVAPTSATIAPQASQTFTVTVDPTAAGGFSGTFRVNSNDPDTPAIDFCFTGTGT